MTTLLERLDTDAITLLPGRAALLDVLALRRPADGATASSGVVVVGLHTQDLPLGATVLLAATAALSSVLVEGEWLARRGPAEFAVVTDRPLEDAAARLLAPLAVPASAGLCPITAGRDAAEVLRLAALGLGVARAAGPGLAYRHPAC